MRVLKDVDLTGKTILITGTTAGIGKETARVLALKGAHVVMANRNLKLSEELRNEIYKETPHRKIDIVQLDLSSLASVKHAAEEFLAKKWPLHVLILNAGVNYPPSPVTKDGYEVTFGINHLGHFSLIREASIFSTIYALLLKPFGKNVEQGAATTVYCATSPYVENESGRYYADCADAEKDLNKALARDENFQDALWSKSLEFIQKFEQNQSHSRL
uniref:Retinol dehydrogenase 11 n=1 Tax=Acrobeloides nanus TaxID=290746 RepID=A0A914C9M5_9BILA